MVRVASSLIAAHVDPYVDIVQQVEPGAGLIRRWPLRGGVSAHVEALALVLPNGVTKQVVIRRHGAAAWKTLASDVTTTEFHLLSALSTAGLPVPAPLFLETRPERLGSAFFVMSYIDGQVDLTPSELPNALVQIAECLHRVHSLAVDSLSHVPLPAREDPIDGALSLLSATDPVCDVLRSLRARPTSAVRTLVHGDFWPGNLLWKDGKLVAVLDWEDAAFGDPVSDLAQCRLELLWKHDATTAAAFSEHYLSLSGLDTTSLPVWELYAASAAAASMSDWGLPPEREADMRAKAERVINAARTTLLRTGS